MKVLVTGGAGFIGSHVVDLLIKSGHVPIVVDHLGTGIKDNLTAGVKFYKIDITSTNIEDVFENERPDIVIHLAAQVDIAHSIKDPAGDAFQNIIGTVRLLTCCQKYQVKKFIFSSTCAVYGEQGDKSIQETFHIQPISYYAISKYTSELYIQAFNALYKVPFTILRYANVYGPRQSSKGEGGVVSIFFKKLLAGESPSIYGDGEQTRDFIYVKDVAKANILAIEKGTNQIFNIGCNSKTSINELYSIMTKITGQSLSPIPMPERDGDIRHSCLDSSKAVALLNWNPDYDLSAGLLETYNHYCEQSM